MFSHKKRTCSTYRCCTVETERKRLSGDSSSFCCPCSSYPWWLCLQCYVILCEAVKRFIWFVRTTVRLCTKKRNYVTYLRNGFMCFIHKGWTQQRTTTWIFLWESTVSSKGFGNKAMKAMVISFALQDLGLLSRAARWAWRMVAVETLASLAEGLGLIRSSLCAFAVGVLQLFMCLYSSKRVERRVWQGPVMILHVPCLLLQKMLCFPSLCFQNRDRPLHCEILMTSCHGGRIHWASAAGKVHSWPVLQAAFELWSAPLSAIVPQYATAGTRPTVFYQHISSYFNKLT